MLRKLIKQGGSGLTMYLPKKWVDVHKLAAGDEVGVDVHEDTVVVSAKQNAHKQKLIKITVPTTANEAVARILIVNPYRAGFDRLEVSFEGNADVLFKIVNDYMVGFEIFRLNKNLFMIESVSEPSYDKFENLVSRQVLLIGEILNSMESPELESLVHKLNKSDNFLKRCLSKGVFTHPAPQFLWQFLSLLSIAGRSCLRVWK